MPQFKSKITLRYILLQIPGIVVIILIFILVQNWLYLPLWLILLILAIWIIKDAVLFFFVWPAYDWKKSETQQKTMIGKIGQAREELNPDGYVAIEGELWYAEHSKATGAIGEGQKIRVIGLEGLKVIVESLTLHTNDG